MRARVCWSTEEGLLYIGLKNVRQTALYLMKLTFPLRRISLI